MGGWGDLFLLGMKTSLVHLFRRTLIFVVQSLMDDCQDVLKQVSRDDGMSEYYILNKQKSSSSEEGDRSSCLDAKNEEEMFLLLLCYHRNGKK